MLPPSAETTPAQAREGPRRRARTAIDRRPCMRGRHGGRREAGGRPERRHPSVEEAPDRPPRLDVGHDSVRHPSRGAHDAPPHERSVNDRQRF